MTIFPRGPACSRLFPVVSFHVAALIHWLDTAGFEIEVADIVLPEADQPDIALLFLDADVLSGNDLTRIGFLCAKQLRPR